MPFLKVAKPSEPWYYVSPLGVHKLSGMVKEMFSAVDTNRKTTTAFEPQVRVFETNVPEKSFKSTQGTTL